MQFVLNGKLSAVSSLPADTPYVEILTRAEFDARYGDLVQDPLLMRSMTHTQHCKADLYRHYILGTLHVPDKQDILQRAWDCAFYLDADRLLLISDDAEVEAMVHGIAQRQITDLRGPVQALFEFLEAMIREDEDFTDAYEDRLEAQEGEIQDCVQQIPADFDRSLMRARRELMVLSRFYKQLAQIGDQLAECPNGVIHADECHLFQLFSHRAERLHADVSALREYALQILDLYQSRISVRQNRIVQILTILSAVFMPLTLIVGWYGMNFSNMPALRSAYGYPVICLLSVAIVAAEWIIFKKKKWM